jgi:hypothetical protein
MSVENLSRQIANLADVKVVPKTTNVLELNLPIKIDGAAEFAGAVTCDTTLAVTGVTTLTGALIANGGVVNGSIQGALVALSGGGQSGATALKSGLNKVITVAALHDSCALPAALAGASVQVQNAGANHMDVYPLGASDVIQSLGTTVSMLVAAGSTLEFRCIVAGTWAIFGCGMLESAWSTGTTTTTFTAGQLGGGGYTTYVSTAATPGSIATRTATLMINDFPNAQVGSTYVLEVVNLAGSNDMTITAGTGVTLTGSGVVTHLFSVKYQVTFNTATTLTMQRICTVIAAA